MHGVLIGCAQMTWGTAPEEQILAETAQAGYEGSFAVWRGNRRSAQETLDVYCRYGLKPVPSYLSGHYWDPNDQAAILQGAEWLSGYMHDVGCTEVFAGTRRLPERDQVAARVRPADALSAEGYRQFADTLNRVGEITLKRGVRTCFHSHVGSYIETREEIDRLMDLVDPDLVFQGVDIGHLAWAGVDPVQFCRDYANQIKAVHIKDINLKVREQGISEGWAYQRYSDRGIFAEICEGSVDFPGVFGALRDANYQGWVVVETDVTMKPTALESATISRRNLRSMGL